MKLEDQVCSLELAKKLKELGVESPSFFAYFKLPSYEKEWEVNKQLGNIGLPAYTVAELGEMLPDNLCMCGEHPNLFIAKGTQESNKWTIGYSTMERSVTPFYTEENEANARAKMLIYLIENKLIEALENVING